MSKVPHYFTFDLSPTEKNQDLINRSVIDAVKLTRRWLMDLTQAAIDADPKEGSKRTLGEQYNQAARGDHKHRAMRWWYIKVNTANSGIDTVDANVYNGFSWRPPASTGDLTVTIDNPAEGMMFGVASFSNNNTINIGGVNIPPQTAGLLFYDNGQWNLIGGGLTHPQVMSRAFLS